MEDVQIDSVTLDKITDIFNKEREIDRSTGRKFNVFNIADIERKEVKMCLVLRNLLDPNGSHQQGSFFLESFCRTVLNLGSEELTNDELRKARVKNEYSIHKSKRRIDIVIITPSRFIPIEVKIKAKDEERQCFDYYEESLSQNDKNAVVFYLTPDGSPPSEVSLAELSEDSKNITDKKGSGKIRCISFRDDISQFLSDCIADRKINSVPPVREVLVQLLDTVRAISGYDRSSELTEKIKEVIPKEINLKSLSEDKKNYFLNETMKKFLERENLPKSDPRIINEIENLHNWKYRLSNDIGKTSNGESISVSINVDVDEFNAYWGMTLKTCRNKRYDDKLMSIDPEVGDPEVKRIIDEKIGDDHGRENTWIFKEERFKILKPETIDFYRLLIPGELDALVDEAVDDLDRIFKKYLTLLSD